MAERCETRQGEYTKDGSVDLRGNPVLRSNRGGWTACGFVVGNDFILYEVFERMAHLGRYWTFVIASIIYLSHSLRPSCCGANTNDPNSNQKATSLQLAVFFWALDILAIGTDGTKPNISTIGADQFDEFDPKECVYKLSFFNWWVFSIFFGTLFANTILVYIQDNVKWTFGYGLPTLGLVISIYIFVAGTPFYRHKLPSGSPFTSTAKIFVAAVRKWRVTLPDDPNELHGLNLEEYAKKEKF